MLEEQDNESKFYFKFSDSFTALFPQSSHQHLAGNRHRRLRTVIKLWTAMFFFFLDYPLRTANESNARREAQKI
jgi:hypothetical protein